MLLSITKGQDQIISLFCKGSIEGGIILDEICHNIVGILVLVEIMIGKFEGVGFEEGENSCLVLENAVELVVLKLFGCEVLGAVVGGLSLHYIELL